MKTKKSVTNRIKLQPKNDFIFQKIFSDENNKTILTDFLQSILKTEISDIEIIKNTKLEKEYPDDKLGILDIRAIINKEEHVDIEMQLVNQYNMDKRTGLYLAKLFSSQAKSGMDYSELKKVITINIMDFSYIKLDDYHTTFHLYEDTHKDYKLTDIFEIHFLQFPEFNTSNAEIKPSNGDTLENWMLFLGNDSEEVREMLSKINPQIAKAYNVLDIMARDQETIRRYELREKALSDEISRINGAKREGIQEGILKGIEKNKLEMAKNLLDVLDIETIAIKTGLPLEEIRKLKSDTQIM